MYLQMYKILKQAEERVARQRNKSEYIKVTRKKTEKNGTAEEIVIEVDQNDPALEFSPYCFCRFLGHHKILTRTPGQFLWRCIIISVKQKTFDYISIGFHVRFLLYKFKGIGYV
jgi:hypothetical protein